MNVKNKNVLTKEERTHFNYTKLFTRLVFKTVQKEPIIQGKEYEKWLTKQLNSKYKITKR